MKRKRGSGKRKPKKVQVEFSDKASPNYASDCGDIGNDGSDHRVEAETTQADTTMRCNHGSLHEPAFLGETTGVNSTPNNNILKNVASFAVKLSRAVGSSSDAPMDESLSLQEEKKQRKEPRISYQDPQCNEQELNAALVVIKKIMKTDAAKPFNVPVDPAALGIPDYFDIIDRPMDFGTICCSLESGLKYRYAEDVYKDVQLIWDNCSKYNEKGDYILEVMKRVKSNFIKQWNAAGLHRQQQEVDKDKGSMTGDSIDHGQPDLLGMCQMQQQQYSSCFSHNQPQNLLSQCPCECQPMEFQSPKPHCSRHLGSMRAHNLCGHMSQGSPVTGKHYGQQQDEIRPHQDLPHHLSPSCTAQCHSQEKPYKCQSSSIIHQPLALRAGRNTQIAVPVSCNVSQHKHYQMCPCYFHDHQSLLSCSGQYLSHHKTCHCQSNSSEMQNREPGIRDAGHPHVHSPVESTVRHWLKHSTAPVTDGSSPQLQCQVGPSQIQSSSMTHSHSYQPQENNRQCKLDLCVQGPPLPQDGANNGGTEHLHVLPPTESTVRHGTCLPESSGTPVIDDCSDQEECQMGLHELQSPLLGQSDPPKGNGSLCQPRSSPPEPSLPQGGPNVCNGEFTALDRKTRGRGPTRCLKLLGEGKQISIMTNEKGVPVGPEASKLVSFLGTLARNGNLAPLAYVDWRAVPEENKENMWEEVQKRFEIDPKSKGWVIKSLSKKWRDWKAKLKAARYIIHTTDEERLADRDERVLPDQWEYLVSQWSSEKAEKRSAANKANRAQQKFGHITGTKSFARISEEQRVNRPDGKAPSRAELFILTRTRKDGKPVNEASSAVITQLREFTNQQEDTSQNSTAPDDIFSQVIGRDSDGRVRCPALSNSPDSRGAKPTQAETMKMASEANDEVRQMKERLVAMEQTCAQMAQQMATMISMMSSMQKNSAAGNGPDAVINGSGSSEASPKQQVHSRPSRFLSRKGKR